MSEHDLTVAEQRALAWLSLVTMQDRTGRCGCRVCEWLRGQRRSDPVGPGSADPALSAGFVAQAADISESVSPCDHRWIWHMAPAPLTPSILQCSRCGGFDWEAIAASVADLILTATVLVEDELATCRQELAVQVARANCAEADRDLALVRPDAVPEIQGRLRRIAEAQLRELDAEVRRLRALVPLEQRHARTAGDG